MLPDPEHFRCRLLAAFPPEPFFGEVSTHDECEEGIALRRTLPGQSWDQIPTAFVDLHSGSLPLLEPKALVAFLPAWLLRSSETLSDESVLAEFTMYFLCPGNQHDGWREKDIEELVRLFNPAQRSVVCGFLRPILENEKLRYWHAFARFGLTWWGAC
ncbi:MAG: hypothetical protein J0L64_23215 [Acidobacteria bacterium]|nr:hypothetical protein [Acidobacteriota bacterium]